MAEVQNPATVQGVLVGRIDQLHAAEKDLLQTVAVIGREFALSLLKQVTQETADPPRSAHIPFANGARGRSPQPRSKVLLRWPVSRDFHTSKRLEPLCEAGLS